jgi:hypothetical protein
MHRSGTSAVTRLINLLGPAAPHAGDLVPPSPKNPTGYWESMSLVAFNTRVLHAVGSDMRCPQALPAGWERDPRLDQLRLEAPAAVRQTFPETPWVWKDPRNCLAFAFWHATLDVIPLAVLVHRNPLEIAASAIRRHRDESKIYTLALWERYLRQAFEQLEGLPVRISEYQSVLSDPLAWCRGTVGFLARSGVPTTTPADEDVLEFVDPSLRHTSFSTADFVQDGDVSDSQRELFCALNELVGDHDEFRPPALPRETPTTEALLAERRRAFQLVDSLRQEMSSGRRLTRRSFGRSGLTPTE